ncbi:hypothetical protein ACT17Q_12710 [Cellulomonas sp. CW35]|uniref:hypothetical protein n=1 Tax=Cellulomonas sp. CW35 TaxID=3458249 RepID=UPI0040337075
MTTTPRTGRTTATTATMTGRTESMTLGAGERSRGFAPNPLDHARARSARAHLVALREVERAASRAGLR